MTFKPNGKTMMAPDGAPRWYDGELKLPAKRIIKSPSLHSSLWIIRCVVKDPRVQMDHQ